MHLSTNIETLTLGPCLPRLAGVRVQRLCHLYDSMLLNDQVVPTTYDQGVTNEPISKVNTNYLALPVSFLWVPKYHFLILSGKAATDSSAVL